MNELDFNTTSNIANDTTKVGYRLESMEVLNWGTFDEKVWKIEPNRNTALLTGDVGSGKSTIVDAITCLIVPHNEIIFNKSAGAERKERSLESYIKGEYKNVKNSDSSTREKAVSLRYNSAKTITFSVLIANFTNKDSKDVIALAQVFWIESGKVKKILLIREKEKLSIQEHFSKSKDPKELRKNIKALSNVEIFDSFSSYSQKFRHLFGMNSKQAIDLFYQTVSMKSVASLNTFVKEQMLEQTDIKEKIEELKKQFDNLNRVHQAVIKARKKKDALLPLQELDKELQTILKQQERVEIFLSAMPSYFATQKIIFLKQEIKISTENLNRLENRINQIKKKLEEHRDNYNQIRQLINDKGGERLKQIENDIKSKEESKKQKSKKHEKYTSLTSILELQNVQNEETFFKNLTLAKQQVKELEQKSETLLNTYAEQNTQFNNLKIKIRNEEKELASLKTRKNQIPLAFLELREILSNELNINTKEIPFAGELLKVNENEKEWEAALEKLLKSFGMTLLVPQNHYKDISKYINETILQDKRKKGLRLEFIKVDLPFHQTSSIYNNGLENDSVFYKIEIKNSPFYDWLESQIQQRYNFRCVSFEDFKRIPSYVITKNGFYKTSKNRHIKDDRNTLWDRRNFVLGWTNEEKIKAVENSLNELLDKAETLQDSINKNKLEREALKITEKNLNELINNEDWFELNWQDDVKAIHELTKEREEIKAKDVNFEILEVKAEIQLKEIAKLEEERSKEEKNSGAEENKIIQNEEEIRSEEMAINTLNQEEKDNFYPIIREEVKDILKNKKETVELEKQIRQTILAKQGTLNDDEKKNNVKITRVMQSYKNDFAEDALELTVEIASIPEYIEKLNEVISNDLPKHEDAFKKRLNENTMQDLFIFNNDLETSQKTIINKINQINEHLRTIEFNQGTYIEIVADKTKDIRIKAFKDELKSCLELAADLTDVYAEYRFEKVQQLLNKFRSNENKHIEWTKLVTDVRNWFSFGAWEKYEQDNSEKEFFARSSGKSGGQKEKLAYTIIASSLAYQFGVGQGENKSFRFAVIDEAFGKGSDASAEYGLELFKKLNLQLLIVTPLQKIQIIENYINAVHYVSNSEGNNSQILNLTLEEYKMNKLEHNK